MIIFGPFASAPFGAQPIVFSENNMPTTIPTRDHREVVFAGPGAAQIVVTPNSLPTISVPPGVTATVEYTYSSGARIADETAIWEPWAGGAAKAGPYTESPTHRIVAVRITKTNAGAGLVNVTF
jgi:hypothetical protein